MKFLLTVMFITTLKEPVLLDGWHPMLIEGEERCERGAERIRQYLIDIDLVDSLDNIIDVSVDCILVADT